MGRALHWALLIHLLASFVVFTSNPSRLFPVPLIIQITLAVEGTIVIIILEDIVDKSL